MKTKLIGLVVLLWSVVMVGAVEVYMTGSGFTVTYMNVSIFGVIPKYVWLGEAAYIQDRTNYYTRKVGPLAQQSHYDAYRWREQKWWFRNYANELFVPRYGFQEHLYMNGGTLTNRVWTAGQFGGPTHGMAGDYGRETIIDDQMKWVAKYKVMFIIDNTLGDEPRVIVFTYKYIGSDGFPVFMTFKKFAGSGQVVYWMPSLSGVSATVMRYVGYTIEVPLFPVKSAPVPPKAYKP